MTAPLFGVDSPREASVCILAGAEGGKIVGTGLYVSGGLVATCAHVVREAAGLPAGQEPVEGSAVRLRFSGAKADRDRAPCVARVAPAGWWPQSDLAILQLDEPAPFAAGWTQGRDLQPHEALDLNCFGFGDAAGPDGVVAAARVMPQAVVGHEADLLNRDDDAALRVGPGYSGAPVCDGLTVLGLLSRRRVAQGIWVSRMVLWRCVEDALNASLAATLNRDSTATHLAPLFALAHAGVAEAGRQTNNRNPRMMRALQDFLTDLEGQVGRADLLESPARIGRACANLFGLERACRELRDETGTGGVSMLGLDGVAALMAGLLPVAEAAASGAAVVDSDWEDDAWRAEVEALLARIDDRLAFLDAAPPGIPAGLCDEAGAALARLRLLLLAPTISLADLDAIRAELERLDRDVFEALIEACELLLGTRAADLPARAIFRDRLPDLGVGPEMVVIPAGRFMMGSPEDEEGRYDDEGPRHAVTIARRFALARYPVTVDAYDRFCAATGLRLSDARGAQRTWPAASVSWDDAAAFCAWLSQATGAQYRLPSESEWEYACRAGTATAYPWGDAWDAGRANGFEGGPGEPSPVGSYPANLWELHDVIGNVWEWVEDRWHDSHEGAPDDGSARLDPGSGEAGRVRRGGSWGNDPTDCRAAYRGRLEPGGRLSFAGFRPARTL